MAGERKKIKACLAALVALHVNHKSRPRPAEVPILGRLPAHLVRLQQCGQDAVLLQILQHGVGGALDAGVGIRPLPALPGLLLVLQIRNGSCCGFFCL